VRLDDVAAFGAPPGSGAATAGLGVDGGAHAEQERTWYARVVHAAFRRGMARWGTVRGDVRNRVDAGGAQLCAAGAIRRACLKSAAAGAFAGSVATGAAVFTAQTKGWGALAGVPVTAGAVAAETLFRAVLHADLACELAEIYGVPFDADDEDDLWRLYALVFRTCGDDGRAESRRSSRLIERITKLGHQQTGDAIGRRVLRDALDRARVVWPEYIDLVLEGMWFIFSADGALTPEEAAMLAHMLRELDPAARRDVMRRFVDDERDWIERARTRLPEDAREPFLHTLEVAAALDKKCFVPERRILARLAEAFGRRWDASNVERLIAELSETGVAKQ
jgi:hypothetical protein